MSPPYARSTVKKTSREACLAAMIDVYRQFYTLVEPDDLGIWLAARRELTDVYQDVEIHVRRAEPQFQTR